MKKAQAKKKSPFHPLVVKITATEKLTIKGQHGTAKVEYVTEWDVVREDDLDFSIQRDGNQYVVVCFDSKIKNTDKAVKGDPITCESLEEALWECATFDKKGPNW